MKSYKFEKKTRGSWWRKKNWKDGIYLFILKFLKTLFNMSLQLLTLQSKSVLWKLIYWAWIDTLCKVFSHPLLYRHISYESTSIHLRPKDTCCKSWSSTPWTQPYTIGLWYQIDRWRDQIHRCQAKFSHILINLA